MNCSENYSLNELQALTKRAARGAGFSWSLASQCAFATRRLHLHSLNGAKAISDYLQLVSTGHACFAPTVSQAVWECEQGNLCPILTGSALSDFDSIFTQRAVATIALSQLVFPVLLLPFVSMLCNTKRNAISVSWLNVSVVCCDKQWEVHGDTSHLYKDNAPTVTIELAISSATSISSNTNAVASQSLKYKLQRAVVDSASYMALDKLAFSTYAPNTEQSRLSGAGAGVTDND